MIFSGSKSQKRALIIGCGDIGRRVASLHLDDGWEVHALSHTAAHIQTLAALGIHSHEGDLDDAASLATLPFEGSVIFYFAPPPASGRDDPRMINFLTAIGPEMRPGRVVYISTSGVYGNACGDWVTEATPPDPQTDRSRRRLAAEQVLQAWGRARDIDTVILRVGGIYGPGRLPLARLEKGLPILRPEEAPYSNRIHADDLARVCVAAAEKGRGGEIYNICDGEHSTMSDYFIAVSRAAGLPEPPQISRQQAETELSSEMLSYLNESRRMDNRKMVEELGITLCYPDLASGLDASLE